MTQHKQSGAFVGLAPLLFSILRYINSKFVRWVEVFSSTEISHCLYTKPLILSKLLLLFIYFFLMGFFPKVPALFNACGNPVNKGSVDDEVLDTTTGGH